MGPMRQVTRVFNGEFGLLFLLGWLMLGLMTTSPYDIITQALGKTYLRLALLFVVAFLVLLIIFFALDRFIRRRIADAAVPIEPDRRAEGHRALVVLVGPGGGRPHESAVAYHRAEENGAALRVCWYIYTPEARQAGLALEQGAAGAVHFHPIPIPGETDARAAYRGVSEALDAATSAAITPPLTEADLIVDITGGTKPMTAGAVVACAERGVALQYMYSPRNERGEIIAGRRAVAMKVELARADGAARGD